MPTLNNNFITRLCISFVLALPAYFFLFLIRDREVGTITLYGYAQYSLFVFLSFMVLFETHQLLSTHIEKKIAWKDKFKLRFTLEILFILIFAPIITTLAYSTLYIIVWDMPIWTPSIILYAGLGVFISTIFMGFVNANVVISYWKQSLIRAESLEKENIKAHLNSLQAQLSPHFLFNNFNIIDALIEDNPKLAREYIQKLSEVFRYILDIKDKEVAPIEDELRFLNDYLFLLNIRFSNNIHASIDLSNKIKSRQIPPASLQLLLENAIKHNEVSSKSPLVFKVEHQEETLVITNNKKPKKLTFEGTGTGLSNLNERYKILVGMGIEIINNSDSFIVKIPLLSIQH